MEKYLDCIFSIRTILADVVTLATLPMQCGRIAAADRLENLWYDIRFRQQGSWDFGSYNLTQSLHQIMQRSIFMKKSDFRNLG